MYRGFIIVILLLALTGCSVHYGPRIPGFVPGYVDQRLGENTYQVKVGEAWPKDWNDLSKFALYRAAELTQTQGKRYYAVLDASTQISNYTVAMPETTTTTGTASVYGRTAYINATSVRTGGGESTFSGGWYSLEFKIVNDDEIGSYGRVIDSQAVMSDLKYFIDSRR
jgi:hypothetical protein